ncbi:MAG TPA: deoxyribose-phosphate aldolase [Polyangia bacterium]|nr:deoxyribose-phosphate aldolase [Polyangia bacterium]
MTAIDTKLASVIDHTLLRPEAEGREVDRLCVEALRFGFAAVCVQPCWVERAARTLAGSRVAVASVVSFPHGASVTAIKVAETSRARDDGATEIDVVANLGWIRERQDGLVRDEVAAIVRAARGAAVKVILETAYWSPERSAAAARAAVEGGAKFVKTSTGFATSGATEEAVRTLRAAVGPDVGVKASGGVRTRAQALALLAAGANRIGASTSVALVTDGGGNTPGPAR